MTCNFPIDGLLTSLIENKPGANGGIAVRDIAFDGLKDFKISETDRSRVVAQAAGIKPH